MGYYEERVAELNQLLSRIETEKKNISSLAQEEGERIDRKIGHCKTLENGVHQLAKERQIGFPWLSKAYEELFALHDKKIELYLTSKKRPAERASLIVKEQTQKRREAEKRAKIAEYLLSYYESIAPFLVDLKEELALDEKEEALADYSEEERQDRVTQFLTIAEYRKLPSHERNQKALDRFWSRPQSKWMIGRLYERYVGYLYEKDGYDVEYVGVFKGLEDLGRDLICKKNDTIIVIQCKNWAQFRTIYEKHIFQFFGTVFQYRDENRNKKVIPVFYTTTRLSELARRFAQELSITLKENFVFDKKYPCVKCNISQSGEKIYHLPFDQQYDKVKIEPHRHEFYCSTTKEAEDAGFRRAFRWKGHQENA